MKELHTRQQTVGKMAANSPPLAVASKQNPAVTIKQSNKLIMNCYKCMTQQKKCGYKVSSGANYLGMMCEHSKLGTTGFFFLFLPILLALSECSSCSFMNLLYKSTETGRKKRCEKITKRVSGEFRSRAEHRHTRCLQVKLVSSCLQHGKSCTRYAWRSRG